MLRIYLSFIVIFYLAVFLYGWDVAYEYFIKDVFHFHFNVPSLGLKLVFQRSLGLLIFRLRVSLNSISVRAHS
jgi:hypothetical protein